MADPTQQNRQAIGDAIASILPNSPLAASLGPEARAKAELDAQNELALQQMQAEGGQASIPFANAPSQPIPQQNIPVEQAPVSPSAPIDRSQLAINQQMPQAASPQPQQSPTINIDKYQKDIQKAADEGAKAAKEEAAFTQNFYNEQEKKNAELINEQLEKEKQISEKINIAQQELDNISSQKIDPNRLFSNQTVWEKLGTVILGALAGPNAGQIIQNRINQDIAAQEKNLDSQYTAANKKLSYLQELRDTYKDTRMAKEALKAGMYQAAQMKLQSFAARTKNADAQAKAGQQIAELEIQKQEALGKIGAAAKANITASQGEALLPQDFKDQAPKELQERAVVLPNGKIGVTLDKMAAKEMRAVSSSTQESLSAIDKLKQYMSNGKKLDPEQRASAETEIKGLVAPLRVAIVGGALSEAEREFLLDIIGNPNKVLALPGTEKAKLAVLEAKIKRDFDTKAKTYGITSFSYGSKAKSLKKN